MRHLRASAGDIRLYELVYPIKPRRRKRSRIYKDDNVIEDVIQPPTIHEVMRPSEILQTCTFYDADYGDEMRAKVNASSKL